MSMTGLRFQVQDEACVGYSGEYFNRYYVQAGSHEISTGQLYIGKYPQGPEESIAAADEAEAELVGSDDLLRGVQLSAASSVLRLCMRHSEPLVEIVQNTIVVPPQSETITLEGDLWANSESGDTGGVREEIMQAKSKPFERNGELVVYMPRASYAGIKEEHEAIYTDRGARSHRKAFALLGGEVILSTPTAPLVGESA